MRPRPRSNGRSRSASCMRYSRLPSMRLSARPNAMPRPWSLRSRRPISIPWSARYSGTERTCRRSPQKTLQRRRWSAGNGARRKATSTTSSSPTTELPRTFRPAAKWRRSVDGRARRAELARCRFAISFRFVRLVAKLKRMLKIKGLRKTFGSVIAADDIDLSVAPGEALGIIGPNGAGKTTLFNLIAGGLAPDAGEIRLNGRNITAAKPHERCIAGIGRSYQIPRPFENLTVFENLLVAAVHGGGSTERAAAAPCAEILERLHLLRRATTLAGARALVERKRLEMARALATNPHLLLLDEIAGGLTEGECLELIETIKQVHAAGMTIVWIEHIVHALVAVVGKLSVLNLGKKVAEGDPQQVMASADVRQFYIGLLA